MLVINEYNFLDCNNIVDIVKPSTKYLFLKYSDDTPITALNSCPLNCYQNGANNNLLALATPTERYYISK